MPGRRGGNDETGQVVRRGRYPAEVTAPDPLLDVLGVAPGLPDDVFDHDGLITKRPLRACALAELRPGPGRVLWDIGTGAGSIAIEWCRAGGLVPQLATAYGIERDPVRAARARRNAERLTAPGQVHILQAVADDAVLAALPRPDAVFIGGGGSAGVVRTCLAALRPGGRLVAHAVTIDTEEILVAGYRAHGGTLTRLAVETAEPLGGMLGWKPLRPVVQWSYEVHDATS